MSRQLLDRDIVSEVIEGKNATIGARAILDAGARKLTLSEESTVAWDRPTAE
jgi:hypothetical protein